MLNLDRNIKITRKGFEFPLSIKAFVIDETSRVATYTYAGIDGALHERVMQYRVINLSWTFSSDSGTSYGGLTPSNWISNLQRLNDNQPWLLTHSLLWNYTCIIHDLKITHNWENTEPSAGNDPVPNFDFEIEFREHTHSNFNQDLDAFRPAISVRPPSDLYNKSLKYTTCDQLYDAIIDGLILPWTDPIINAEWQLYDINMRTCAYNRWIANPNWENSGTHFDKKGNIVANKPKTTTTATPTGNNVVASTNLRLYVVQSWDTAVSVAKLFKVTVEDLMKANSGRNVREVPNPNDIFIPAQGKRWVYNLWLYVWDKLVIPPANIFAFKPLVLGWVLVPTPKWR